MELGFIETAIALVIVIFTVIGVLFSIFYKRASKNMAFVRTGYGGEKVIITDGALVFPILHEMMRVNMQTFLVKVERNNEYSLITQDPLRVNVVAEFRLSIPPDKDMISIAARTLEHRTQDQDAVQEFVEEQCVAALRSAASRMTLQELHAKRTEFEQNVEQAIEAEFQKNGLRLASVSLVRLDQTSQDYLDPDNNTFDAEGLTIMTRITEDNRKTQNSIRQESEVAIQQKDLETEKQKLDLELQEFYAQKETEKNKAEREAEIARQIEEINIAKEVSIEMAKQDMEITRSQMEKAMAEARIDSDKKVAESAAMTEQISTAREKAEADRQKIVEVILAEKEAQRQTIIARANAEVERLASDAAKLRYGVEAKGKEAMNRAANELSPEQIAMQVKMEVLRQLPEIVRESVKPMENIDSIKVMQLDGLNGVAGGSGKGEGAAANGSNPSLPDQVVNSALRYRAHLPLMESLLREVDLKGEDGSMNGLTQSLQEEIEKPITQADNEPKQAEAEHEPEALRAPSIAPTVYEEAADIVKEDEIVDVEPETPSENSNSASVEPPPNNEIK